MIAIVETLVRAEGGVLKVGDLAATEFPPYMGKHPVEGSASVAVVGTSLDDIVHLTLLTEAPASRPDAGDVYEWRGELALPSRILVVESIDGVVASVGVGSDRCQIVVVPSPPLDATSILISVSGEGLGAWTLMAAPTA